MAVAGLETNGAIATKFGVGRKIVGRHIARHMVPVPDPDDPGTTVYTLPTDVSNEPVEVLEAQMDRLQRVLAGDLSPRDRMDMEKQLTTTATQLARSRPPKDLETPEKDRADHIERQLRAVLSVTDGYPRIRAEIAKALEDLEE